MTFILIAIKWVFIALFAIVSAVFTLILLIVILITIARLLGFFKPYKEKHRAHRKRAAKGEGFDIAELARRLGVTPEQLQQTPRSYHRVTIPKKRGGTRTLHVPNPQLKNIQRLILRRLLRQLRAHPCNTAFERGKSIVDNALPHVAKAVVIHMDIKDFFDTTARDRIEQYFRRIGWNAVAAALLADLTCHDTGLPQGAPTSPRLSNLVNYVMDARIERYVAQHRGQYTRYADDITVSYPKDRPKYVRGTVQLVQRTARRFGYAIHLKHKLRISRQHQQQRVTGLVVNEKVQLPRTKRRLLRAIRHHLATRNSATLTLSQLAGWDALQQMIAQQSGQSHIEN